MIDVYAIPVIIDLTVSAVTTFVVGESVNALAKQEAAIKRAPVIIDLTVSPAVTTFIVEKSVWPDGSKRMRAMVIPAYFRVDSLGDVDPVKCCCLLQGRDSCIDDICGNAGDERICTADTCSLGKGCGNRFSALPALDIRPSPIGLAVFSTGPIRRGQIVAPYWGTVSVGRRETANYTVLFRHRMMMVLDGGDAGTASTSASNDDEEWTPKQRGKRRAPSKRASSKKVPKKKKPQQRGRVDVYVDAESGGGIARFVNHSCDALCKFEERKYVTRDGSSAVTMAIVAIRDIPASTEVTVDYGGYGDHKLWFSCRCKATNCRRPCR